MSCIIKKELEKMQNSSRGALYTLLLFTLLFSAPLSAELPLNLTFNKQWRDQELAPPQQSDELELLQRALTRDVEKPFSEYYVEIDKVLSSGTYLLMKDGSKWKINFFDRGDAKKWQPGERVKIYMPSTFGDYKFKNINRNVKIYGEIDSLNDWKTVKISLLTPVKGEKLGQIITLTNRFQFYISNSEITKEWKVGEMIFLFNNEKEGYCDLLNINRKELLCNVKIHVATVAAELSLDREKILRLPQELAKRVIGQEGAIAAVTAALMNHVAGLKDPEAPVGTFLFLGPTGVGKTELAKALAEQVYGSQEKLLRFDMVQFTDYHHSDKLFGSPPGYVNHEEGGQFTEAMKKTPHTVVLFDEIEKAHDKVRKALLPTLEEGYAFDNKHNRIDCKNAIFIMTSNLCYEKIMGLHAQGFDSEEILYMIEPELMQALSPEFYNRVQPVIFSPMSDEMMEGLVNKVLAEVVSRLQEQRQICLVIDESVKELLKVKGYSPKLGARPLKRLVEKHVVGTVSYAIIKEGIPSGSTVWLSYDKGADSWHVKWNDRL